jgi:hypothetical protein
MTSTTAIESDLTSPLLSRPRAVERIFDYIDNRSYVARSAAGIQRRIPT